MLDNLRRYHNIKGLGPEVVNKSLGGEDNIDVLTRLNINTYVLPRLANPSIKGLTLPFTNLLPTSRTLPPLNSPQLTFLMKKSSTATFT